YLSLRAAFDEADPHLERRWVIYVGAPRRDPSWLRDLELAGAWVHLGLHEVVTSVFDLATSSRHRRLLDGPLGRLLALHWDELVPPSPRIGDVERGMLAAALGLGAGADLRDIVLEYVARSDAEEVLQGFDIHDTELDARAAAVRAHAEWLAGE